MHYLPCKMGNKPQAALPYCYRRASTEKTSESEKGAAAFL